MGRDRGHVVFGQLRRAAERSRSRAEEAAGELQQIDRKAENLLRRRAEAFEELARHYLPSLEDVDGATAFRDVRGEIEALIEQREVEMRRIGADIESAREERSALDGELDDTTRALDEKVAERERLEQHVVDTLAADAEFQKLAQAAAESERALHRDEQRVEEIEREAEDKRPAYEGSRLFMYLHERGFGTPDYRGRGFARWGDRKVAGLIGYDEAREGYLFLRKTPELVRIEVDRRRAEFDELMVEVERRQQAAADAAGLPAVLEAGERLGDERERLVERIAGVDARHAQLAGALAELETAQGQFYAKALVRLRAYLEGTERWVLEDRARRTDAREDDRLVDDIRDLDRDLEQVRAQVERLTSRHGSVAATAAALERLVLRFRQAEFDGTRSRFRGLDLDDDLDDLYDGRIDADELWRRIERAQEFEPIARRPRRGAGFDFDDLSDVLDSSGGRILSSVLGSVIGSALGQSAMRSVRRRARSIGRSSPWPGSRPSVSRPPSRPRSGGPGFTRGSGF